MTFKKWVRNIQTASYNGARTVYKWKSLKTFEFLLIWLKNLLRSFLELRSVYCFSPSIWFSVFRARKKIGFSLITVMHQWFITGLKKKKFDDFLIFRFFDHSNKIQYSNFLHIKYSHQYKAIKLSYLLKPFYPELLNKWAERITTNDYSFKQACLFIMEFRVDGRSLTRRWGLLGGVLFGEMKFVLSHFLSNEIK